MQATSEAYAATHLTEREALADAFSNTDSNTQEIERIKIGSNKYVIREDLAKEKMVFSKGSQQRIQRCFFFSKWAMWS